MVRQHGRKETMFLDGSSLFVEDLVKLSTGKVAIDLTKEAWQQVAEGRQVVDNILNEGKVAYNKRYLPLGPVNHKA